MNPAHLHLVLNHFPMIGSAVGLGLLAVAIAVKKEEVKRASLVVLFLAALITIAAYLTGNAAQAALENRTDLSQAAIRTHEGAAFWGFVLIEITGFMAGLGLWYFRIVRRTANWNVAAVFGAGLVTLTVITKASNLVAEIQTPNTQSELERQTQDLHSYP